MHMHTRLPNLDYRATSKLQPGSVIEYEISHAVYKTVRALALILRIDWAPSNARSRMHVLTESGEVRVVDMVYVCQIHAY
jgi:hypothetical protein